MDAGSLVATPRPLPSPEDARRRRDAELRAVASGTFWTAYVAALAGGYVQLKTLGGEILGELYPRLAGVELAIDNLVLVAGIAGERGDVAPVVLGRFDPETLPAPYDPRPIVQTSFTLGIASNGATVPTNAVVGSFQEANGFAFTLPPGIWDVTIDGSAILAHSSGGGGRLRVQLDALAPSTEKGRACPSTGLRLGHAATFSGIAGGAHAAALQYAPSTAGTLSCDQVALTVTGARTA